MGSKSRPLSGLQKQMDIVAAARREFKKGKDLAKNDYERIEYLLRRGRKQLDRIRPESVGGVKNVESSR